MSYRLGRAALCVGLVLALPAPANAGRWTDVSDIGRDVLIGAALGVPAIQGDWDGDLQAGASILAGGGISYGLKHAFPEERPDHSDRRSFPSGHSAESFAAAASLENRYGWKAGLPAFALATLVATARVEARKHHWYDCAAGAAIGTGSGLLLTRRRDDRVRLTPGAARVGAASRWWRGSDKARWTAERAHTARNPVDAVLTFADPAMGGEAPGCCETAIMTGI